MALLIGARARILTVHLKVTALEALNAGGKAGVWLHEVDSELVEAETLKCLGTLHVPLDFAKSISYAIATWSRCKVALYKVRHIRITDSSRFNLQPKVVTVTRLRFYSLARTTCLRVERWLATLVFPRRPISLI